MKHIILGTAGHVDHGKTALIRYITGVDTDRLKEEKARGITIELGFAPFTLPSGRRVGVVDVPGHERFVRHMLAGATGVDLALFVVAANEGVMPQTREHMDILRLLGVDKGVAVLTKIDMVDEEWLDLVREEAHEFLADSPLRCAPVAEVSALTGQGVPELLRILDELCAEVPERDRSGVCRLAADRVFTMPGFGTVVTGTLWGGLIRQGDTLELLPAGKQARVRSLQVHGEARDEAYAGERVAVNLSGVDKARTERGSWLAAPGALQVSRRVDIRLQLLPGAPEMKQHARFHVHHGTAEALARVNLLDRETLAPGGSCFAQLELETPLSVLPGDRVVLRFYSPVFTIGGGIILDAAAVKHKRFREDVLSRLEALDSGDPRRVLLAVMAKAGIPMQPSRIASILRKSDDEARALAQVMADEGELLLLSEDFYFHAGVADALAKRLTDWLNDYLDRRPLRFGVPKKEAAQVLFPEMEQKEQRVFFQYLEDAGLFEQNETLIRPAGRADAIGEKHGAMIDAVRALYNESPFSPPPWAEASAAAGIPPADRDEIFQWFIRGGEWVRLSDEAVITQYGINEAEKLLRAASPDGSFTLAEARDLLGTTRKWAQLLGEYFDQTKATTWDGERRYWKS